MANTSFPDFFTYSISTFDGVLTFLPHCLRTKSILRLEMCINALNSSTFVIMFSLYLKNMDMLHFVANYAATNIVTKTCQSRTSRTRATRTSCVNYETMLIQTMASKPSVHTQKHTGPDFRHENLVHNGSENFQDLGVLQQLCNSEPQNLSDLSVLQLVARPS